MKTSKRLAHGEARERIINTAEALFSQKAPDQVGFRELSAQAGVSISAAHYHFGSKEALIKEIFKRRSEPMTGQRTRLLNKLIDEGRETDLSGILDAFVRPALDVTRGEKEDLFNRLRSRLAIAPEDFAREVISEAFDKNDEMFIAAIHKAVPHLTQAALYYRFHFFVGALVYTMSDSGKLIGLEGDVSSPKDIQETIQQIVTSFTALFRAPVSQTGE